MMYKLESVWFNDKVRYFNTLDELNIFLDHRIPKIATAHKISYVDVYAKFDISQVNKLNIGSGNTYPGNALSNFAPHPFIIDGIQCASMEGFLQSLKTKNPDMQVYICSLVGRKAKQTGAGKNWQQRQILYWQGIEYQRNSDDYQQLITRAYDALFQNSHFKKALKATGNATLMHSMGQRKANHTVLTTKEFIGQLTRLRQKIES